MSITELSNLETFSVSRGSTKERFDPHFHRPYFRKLIQAISRRPFKTLGEIISQSSEVWEKSSGLHTGTFPYIEISAVGLGTNEYNVEIVATKDAPSRARQIVRADDIILSLTRPHRGAIAVIKPDHNNAIASTGFAILRDLKIPSIDRHYLFNVLSSNICLDQLLQRSSGGNYPAITPDQLNKILIPFPNLKDQQTLSSTLEITRAQYCSKLDQANELLVTLDQYLNDVIDLSVPKEVIKKFFAIKLYSIKGKRFDPPSQQPLYNSNNLPKIALTELQHIANINIHEVAKPLDENELVPYVGLPECNQTEVHTVGLRPYREVKGRGVVRVGDILYARIEPSIFNKKYVLVKDLKGHNFAYVSTEFYVVTPKKNKIILEFLYSMFFSSFVYNQAKGKTTGSSGRRRLDIELFRKLQIPLPPIEKQHSIALEVQHRRQEARRLTIEAESEWETARKWFEEQLLGKLK